MISSSRNSSSLLAGVDQVDLAAQVAKHRRVFAADDAGAVDRDRLRRERQVEDRVAVEDPRMLEIDVRRAIGPRAGGDHEAVGGDLLAGRPWLRSTSTRVRIDEPGVAGDRPGRGCARRSRAASPPAGRSRPRPTRRSCGNVRSTRDARLAKQRVVVRLGHLKDRVPQGLAGNRAPVRAAAADLGDSVRPRPPSCRACTACIAAPSPPGPGADDHHVVLMFWHSGAFG